MNYDSSQQLILGLVLAAMMFGVALELRLGHFLLVLKRPLPALVGLLCQCLLLPWLTLVATLLLDLRPGLELGMLLVAACPGGNLSNVITHLVRGNTALSVSVTSLSSLLAILSLPLNFAATASLNPDTAAFLVDKRSIVGIGTDTLSQDPGNSTDFGTHVTILGAGLYGIEGVANLDGLPASGATVVVGGPNHANASGGPARLLALY